MIEPSPMLLEPLAQSLATGHMKTDGRLARCPLKSTTGPSRRLRAIACQAMDAIYAVLCGCGHNIRKILAHLRALLAAFISWLIANTIPPETTNQGTQAA